jgi:C-terminal processing protease CtpA/Prc
VGAATHRRFTRRSGALGHLSAAQLVRRSIRAVRAAYVEKPDDNKLVQSAINGMLGGLDPHSSYMDPNGLRDIQELTRGEYGGLGIEVTMEGALIKVVAPIDDRPAAKAGRNGE